MKTSSRLRRVPKVRFAAWAVALLLGLAWGAEAHGQSGGITGLVTNSATGATLEGARVVLMGTGREVTTDNLGYFRFDRVPAGSVVLSVQYTGLKPQEHTIVVPATGLARQDVGLTADIYLMGSFVVASEREGNAKAITLQRQSDGVKSIVSADAFGGLAGNPADLAMRLPGIEGESVGGDVRYLRIRGLHQNLSSITQDGNRLADAGSAGSTREFQFQTVGSDSVERIEVTKSPTPDMDGDSIGGVVNLVSKSAFDSSPERRIRGSVGAIWRPTDERDRSRPNASFSYSEVFGGKFGVNVNLAYRPHGSIIDVTSQAHELLPIGTSGPAYQYSLTAQDFRNVRTRSGAGVKLDYKWNEQVRFFANFQYNKHLEHTTNSQVTWQTNQIVAGVDAAGNFTGTGGIIPGYTDYETRVRPTTASIVAMNSSSNYKLGTTKTLNVGGVHRYPSLQLDYDVYSSASKAYYPGNNTFTYTMRNAGWILRKDDVNFPTVIQTAGADWTKLESYTENAYVSARSVGWDRYLGAAINAKKFLNTPVPTYIKTGFRLREQTRNLDNTPYNTVYVGPDGVMGPNPANGGINDDNLAQFGQKGVPFPDTELQRYGNMPIPDFQAVGRRSNLDQYIAANPTYWRQNLASNLQSELVNHQQFTEEILAAYFMGNIQLGRFSILSGLRVEDTETEGEGALQQLTPEERARRAAWGSAPLTDAETTRRVTEEYGRRVTRGGDYRSIFPGVHMKYQFTRNLQLRLSYSENIGRPNIGQLIPRTTVIDETQRVTTSNPSLEPQWAKNFDLSGEYYFEPAGLLTFGVFQKNIRKFIYTSSATIIGSGQDNGFDGEYAGYALTTQYNGGYAKVKGLEIGYNQQFTFLPGWLKGFGAFANATWMNAEGNYGAGNAIALVPNPRIAGFNPFIANVGVSYIQNRLNLRASFNYRHKYLVGFNANESRATYAAARPTLDLKTLYNVNRRLSLYLDVVNVLMEPDRERLYGYDRPQTIHLMRQQFFFGANVRL